MRLSFRGWARDHGEKLMVDQRLKRDMLSDAKTVKKGELQISVVPSARTNHNLVKVFFSTDMRLGGDQMGVLTLSNRDLSMMLDASLNQDSN